MLEKKNSVVRVLRSCSAILSILEPFYGLFRNCKQNTPVLVDINTGGAWISFVFVLKKGADSWVMSASAEWRCGGGSALIKIPGMPVGGS